MMRDYMYYVLTSLSEIYFRPFRLMYDGYSPMEWGLTGQTDAFVVSFAPLSLDQILNLRYLSFFPHLTPFLTPPPPLPINISDDDPPPSSPPSQPSTTKKRNNR